MAPMATCFTRGAPMTASIAKTIRANVVRCGAILALAAGLGACADEQVRLSPEFGEAVRQDVAAQIADPDAHYIGKPAPGSNGARVGLAQQRYEEGKVTPPKDMNASTVKGDGSSAK